MILLDTHVLLWAASEPKKLSRRARQALEADTDHAVSSISCWEVTMLERRGRIALDRPVGRWLGQALANIGVIDVSCAIGTAAGQLDGAAFPGDPADRLIWSTAQQLGLPLVTADRALQAFGPTATIW